jgi:cytoskeletal protein CcmA (bactofilin family)
MLQAPELKMNAQKPVGAPLASGPGLGQGSAMEQATLGATMTVKGELSGAQALYIDGRVEGSIHFPDHRVTIGRSAVVLANIAAKEVVINGTVTGNVDCSERVDIRSDGVFTGELITRRISIDEGAMVKGTVEVCKFGKTEGAGIEAKTEKPAKAAAVAASPIPSMPVPPPPVASEATKQPEAASTPNKGAFRVTGSSVLYEEHKAGSH